jgi:hypothetical protein
MALVKVRASILLVAAWSCGNESPSQPGQLDASSLPAVDSERYDARTWSCDPLGLAEELEASPENLARALQQDCFHSGDGRRKLVIQELCRHDRICIEAGDDCAAEYEARWQQRLRPRGLSVPCADALLDAMSCLAQAQCDARPCAAWEERAETTCDPNTPLPGSPMCPPLPTDRELTKGPIPNEAISDAGRLDESRVPDFIPALDRQGEIAGYVRYCAIGTGGAIPVYADDLQTLVGHMIPGEGFLAGPLP